MKGKNIFFALGLALTMGVGAIASFAGAKSSMEAAHADGSKSVTIITNEPGWDDITGRGLHAWGEGNGTNLCGAWGDSQLGQMVLSDGYYRQTVSFNTSMEGAILRFKQGSTYWQTVNLTVDGGFVDGLTYVITGVNWKSNEDGYKLANANIAVYEEHTYSYQINGEGNFVDMVSHSGSEVKSPTALNLSVDDTIAFKKDGAAYNVTPKDTDGNATRVSMVDDKLTVVQAYNGIIYLDTSLNMLWADHYDVAAGYYLVGSHSNWSLKGAIPMTNNDGVYSCDISAAANGTAKIVNVATAGHNKEYIGVKDDTIYTLHDAAATFDDGNLKFTAAGNYTVKFTASEIITGLDDNKYVPYVVDDADYVPDVPATEGYYIKGSKGDWKYTGATKMINYDQDGNVAYYMNYSATANEEIRVASYYTDSQVWAETGTEELMDGLTKLGEKSGDNFKFLVAGNYDLYAKYVGDSEPKTLTFYVSKHVDTHSVEITGLFYEGAHFEKEQSLGSQIAYEGQDFEYTQADQSGYVKRGLFTDEECTIAYVPTEFDADGEIYAKYTKVGFYMIYGASSYSIDGATLMNTQGIAAGNKAEGTIVAAINDTFSCVYYDGSMSGQSGIGEGLSDYAVDEDTHIKFVKAGTYAVYWSNGDNKIYLNEGIVAFCTNFLSVTGGICKDDNTTNLNALKTAWVSIAGTYNTLSASEKEQFTEKTIDSGDKDSPELVLQVIARYSVIVKRYGTANCEDFIWGNTYNSTARFNVVSNSLSNTTLLVLVITTSVVVLGFAATMFTLKKRKHAK